MNEELDNPDVSLPISDLLEIDRICREFEAAWNTGQHPKAEDFLGVTPEPQRSELLKELSALQAELEGVEAAAASGSAKKAPAEKSSRSKPGLKQFTRRLIQSGLMTADECQAFYHELPAERRPRTAEQFAQELHRAGKLTRFQTQAVYQGKTHGLVVGNYVVLDKLGQGGMGYVYKAQHRKMKRVVALKLLPAAAMRTPEAVRRFEREVEAAARLAHPNIVTAYDADEAPGVHFLVMECVEGTDLGRIVQQKGRLDVSAAVGCVLQAARGLDYAHQQGIVHRDIKPSNLLLDKHGTIKILDMGLARITQEGRTPGDGQEPTSSAYGSTLDMLAEDQLTQDGQLVGTCQYMAPEQALDAHAADHRSDVYSLGCTLYKLLVGRPPYESGTVAEIIRAHREAPIPSLRDAQPGVPAELDAVFQKMVAKDPAERQQSMAEVIAELEKHAPAGEARGGTALNLPQHAETPTLGEEGRGDTGEDEESVVACGETLCGQASGTDAPGEFDAYHSWLGIPVKDQPPNLRILMGGGAVVVVVLLGLIVWQAMSRPKSEVAVRPEPKLVQQPIIGREEQPTVPPAVRESEPVPAPTRPPAQEKPLEPSEASAVPSPGKPSATNRAVEQPEAPVSRPKPADPGKPVATPSPAALPAADGSPQRPPRQPASRQKLPVPEGANLEQANKVADALFHAEIERAKTSANKTALAQRLLAQAIDGTVDAAGRYVLMRMAGSLAVAAQDAETAFQCVDQLDAVFDVDRFAMKTAILAGWAKDARTPQARKRLVEQMLAVGDEAVDAGNADAAKELGKLATSKASGLRDKDLAQQLKDYRERLVKAGKNLEELREAQASLAKDPRDPQANLVVGRHFCFVKGDWHKGLPLVAVGSDERLKGLAEKELSALGNPPSATGMPAAPPNPQSPIPNPLELADGWWEMAESDRRGQMNSIKIHAGQWYRLANAGLPAGLVKNNVEKRLAEVAKLRSQLPSPPLAIAPFADKQAKQHQQRWAAYVGDAVVITNSIGMKLILIPPGEFDMGSSREEIAWALERGKKGNEDRWYLDRVPTEGPQHRVKISRPYYLGVYLVTQGEYERVMGVNPSACCAKQMGASAFKPPLTGWSVEQRLLYARRVAGRDTSRHPVETVSWNDAAQFCRRLSELPEERGANRAYRLPTEAEWEYACRAGTTTRWWCGDDEAVFPECAWYTTGPDYSTRPVGEKRASPWGLCDMQCQFGQWCMDWHDEKYYGQSPRVDPTGPQRGSVRVHRGHGGVSVAPLCRSAFRDGNQPDFRAHYLGLRVCLAGDETNK